MLEITNNVLQPILEIVLPFLATACIAWLMKAWQAKRAELDAKQYSTLTWLIETGVWAAEQAYASGKLPKELREDYVIKFIQAEADRYHLVVDVAQIMVHIKAAVAKELNQGRLITSANPSS